MKQENKAPTWRLVLAYGRLLLSQPAGRMVLGAFGGVLVLLVAVGIGLTRQFGGGAGELNTGELATLPAKTAPEVLELPEASEVPAVPVEAEIPAPAPAEAPAVPVVEATVEAAPVVPEVAVVEVPVAAPERVVVEVKPDGSIVEGSASQAELLAEIKRLNEKFDQLQETVNLVVTQMMADVESENDELRSEVRRLQARDQAGLLSSAAVPRPAGELLNSLAEEAQGMTEEELVDEKPLPPAEFSFKVVEEWGRDPEAVAQLGGSAPTLKGVVGTVPRGSLREDVEQLGRDLRAQYAAYDNINIEIFDDPVAAQAFADSQTMDAERRVLSISKYAATERDAMTYYENGESIEVAPDLAEEEAAPVAEEAPEVTVETTAPDEAPKVDEDAPKSKRGRRSGR